MRWRLWMLLNGTWDRWEDWTQDHVRSRRLRRWLGGPGWLYSLMCRLLAGGHEWSMADGGDVPSLILLDPLAPASREVLGEKVCVTCGKAVALGRAA